MTNLVTDQWNKMYKLISQHKFTIIDHVNDDYKCGICKNILINAHQAICGCQFCYECINQYMANGASKCPNNTEECKLSNLSNIVQCANKTCSHECQLIEMENHLNSCLNKAVKCPFNDVGCEYDDMINDKLNDHMLSDIHNHNKILIDLIGNLRNEMRKFKEKVEGNRLENELLKKEVEENRLEIEMLKENDRVKNEIIESLKEKVEGNLLKIESLKQENEEIRDQMEIGDRNLWHKFDEIDIEMKNKCKKDEILIEFDEKIDMKMNARYCEIKEEWNEKFDEKIEKMREENEKSDRYLNMRDCGRLEWQIGKINEIKLMKSEYFYDKQNPYKMCLRLDNINNELIIWLSICSGALDDHLKSPCQAEVTIFISALNNLKICKSVKQTCTIENDSPDCSDPIKFSHSDLTKSNLIKINCLLRCLVKFE